MDGASGRPPVNSPSQSRASTHDGSSHADSLPVRACRRGVLSVVDEIWCSFSEAYSKLRLDLLRSGCADPFPARSCLGGPEAARSGGANAPPSGALVPLATERDRLPRRKRGGESAERDETLPPDPLRIFRRPADTIVAACPDSCRLGAQPRE